MLNILRHLVPERSPLRLLYHKIMAIFAAVYYRFPSRKITVIGVTGTSGKSTTVELIQHLLQKGGKKTASLSTIQFKFGDEILPNETLRTTLKPAFLQKKLRQLVTEGYEYVVLEVSSHAIDQNRVWGIDFDIAVITNVFDNEHLDYHPDFEHYLATKVRLVELLNQGYRKPNTPKISVVNKDNENADAFLEKTADKVWTFGHKASADVRAEHIQLSSKGLKFSLRLPNKTIEVEAPIVGLYNAENLLAAITVAVGIGMAQYKITDALTTIPQIPGRLEMVQTNKKQATVMVEFSYKPSALKAVLTALQSVNKEGKIKVVWGGAGGRAPENWAASAKVIQDLADEFVLTTDDPGSTDPKEIAQIVKQAINPVEGQNFYEIEDRYEAIRYAIYTAEPNDTVLIAGRGHEQIQCIGTRRIPFDDRVVAKEILELKV
jgi:UDP-N-acetylmuramoyl-L-alanyl-D-glutamate--2,6-diaminopimelate ligase